MPTTLDETAKIYLDLWENLLEHTHNNADWMQEMSNAMANARTFENDLTKAFSFWMDSLNNSQGDVK